MLRRTFAWYNRHLQRRPILVQCISTAGLFASGDLLAQQVLERPTHHDYYRTLRFSFFGGCIAGPVMCLWYRVLERVITFKSINKATLTRVALDQCCFAPCSLFLFFTIQSLMEGKNRDQIKIKLQNS
jgi:protein Mpv17